MTKELYDEIIAEIRSMSGGELMKAFEEAGVQFIPKDKMYKGHFWKVRYDDDGYLAVCDSLGLTTYGDRLSELNECIEQSTDSVLEDMKNESLFFESGWRAAMKHVSNSMPDPEDCLPTYEVMRSIGAAIKASPPSNGYMFDWISVKDLLPSVGLKVLGWNGSSHIIVSLDENGCFYDENERVVVCTHWSHLLKGPDKNYDKKKKEIEALRTIELVKPWAKETLEAFKKHFPENKIMENKIMEKFSFTHLRRESGIDLINNLDLASIKHNDLKPVFAYNNKDVRKSLIVLEKQFRLNYVKCLERLKILEQHLLLSGFVYLKDYDGWISTFIKPTNTRIDLNDFYPIFVKKIDDHWIEISYSFRAEVTSNIDEISKESFRIYDASGGSRFSLMWVGGTHIYHANKLPNDMGLIDALLANYLYD